MVPAPMATSRAPMARIMHLGTLVLGDGSDPRAAAVPGSSNERGADDDAPGGDGSDELAMVHGRSLPAATPGAASPGYRCRPVGCRW